MDKMDHRRTETPVHPSLKCPGSRAIGHEHQRRDWLDLFERNGANLKLMILTSVEA